MDDKQKKKMRKLIARLEEAVDWVYRSRANGEDIANSKLELRNARMAIMAYGEWLVVSSKVLARG